MEYCHLGRSRLQVSALALGGWVTWGNQLGEELAYDTMMEARKPDVDFFDTAEVYADGKSETAMGKAIKRAGWKRSCRTSRSLQKITASIDYRASDLLIRRD